MATERSKGAGAGAGTGAQADTQPKIVWDDSGMRSFYSNATSVVGTREEIVLFFGMNQAWHAGQQEVKVQLMDRVVLSPYTAKRLANLLNNVLQDYETRWGKLEIEARRPADAPLS